MIRIRVLGGGWYGCHLTRMLLADGYNVELHEISDRLFSGASGNIPARLHYGFHYPRSKLTRDACREHYIEFMDVYGHLTSNVPINLYCIAMYDSLLDFGTYCDILKNGLEFVTAVNAREFGLENVEGAILTGERHILVDRSREFFQNALCKHIIFGGKSDNDFDLTIDCTFCARDETNIDRFELCLTVLLQGSIDKAVTIMDGPFPSLYPWDELFGICSLTSAKWTPIVRCKSWGEAKSIMESIDLSIVHNHSKSMIEQMSFFYPKILDYRVIDERLAIRAMPRSGCDARLVDIVRIDDRNIRIRAGKIDAIFHAYQCIRDIMRSM